VKNPHLEREQNLKQRILRWSGPLLRKARLARGWSQARLARRLAVEPHRVSRWENGVQPDAARVAQIATALRLVRFRQLFACRRRHCRRRS
jgi:transcriptional regulator with XRE-family HTH domain